MNVRIGKPVNVDGFAGDKDATSYAAISGALLYALRNYEEKGFFQSIFGVFKK